MKKGKAVLTIYMSKKLKSAIEVEAARQAVSKCQLVRDRMAFCLPENIAKVIRERDGQSL